MRVAIYSPEKVPPSNYGGTERVIWWLVKGLKRLGCEIFLLAPPGSYHPGAELVEVFPPKGDPSLTPFDLTPYLPDGVQVLHLHHLSVVRYRFPVLKTFHSIPKSFVRPLIDRFTTFLSRRHRQVSGAPRNPFVYNGIDPDEFFFSEKKDDFLLFLGKLDRLEKGLPLAVEVAKRAGEKLVVAGNYSNELFFKRFLKPYLSKGVVYVGPVDGSLKAELLSKAKALIFPILWEEPFGLVVVEAMVSGTPVVTVPLGAMPELVVHGKTGFLCSGIDDMVRAVKKVDGLNPKECRERVLSRFTHIKMARGYLALYRLVSKTYLLQSSQASCNI